MPKDLHINKKGFNPFCDLIGLEFDAWEEGFSRCRLAIASHHMNPHNVAHGGVLYSMADTGMGAALYPALERDDACATVEIKISYFKPVSAGELVCETRILHRGDTIAYLESVINNGSKLIAKAMGTYCILSAKSKSGSPSGRRRGGGSPL